MSLVRSLRWILLAGLTALAAFVGVLIFTYPSAGLDLPSLEDLKAPETTRTVTQRSTHVEILRTRGGLPTLLLQAAESKTYPGGDLDLTSATFRLFDAQGQETVVEASRALSSGLEPDAQEPHGGAEQAAARSALFDGIGSWVLQGGVTLHGAGEMTLKTQALTYLENEGKARTNQPVTFTRGLVEGSATGMVYDVGTQTIQFLKDLHASMRVGQIGLVTVRAESGRYSMRENTFEMTSYRAATARGESLTGARLLAHFREEGGMQQLQGEKGFVLETTHTTPAGESTSPLSRLLALEGLRTMRGLRLAVNFGPDSEPRSIEVSGQANLTAYDDRSGGAPSSIAARTLSFDLTNGSISHASAVGDVDLQGAPSEGEPEGFQLQSEELNAAFDPNIGSILRIEGQGAIQLTNRDMTSRGSSTFLDPNTDVVTLAGDKDQPAHAEWLDRKIQADLIQADRKGNNLAAEGNVRTSYQPPESRQARAQNQALPFFRRGETIYAMAGSLVFSDGGQIAHYRDRVRLWQGENRLEAMEVDLSEIEGTVDARGDVVSTFRQSVPKGSPRGGTPSDEIVTIDAAWMKYDRDRHVIMYGDRVLLTQGSLRVACERLSVLLKPDGRTADKLDARGSVELHDINRIGRGDRLVANVDADTMVLTGIGREAVIQDATGQQVVRGSSLTMERSSDRIMVESELGGRTWIILKPRQKGAPGVASDPKN